MKYYRISCTGDLGDSSLCLVEDPPEGMGLEHFYMAGGDRAAPFFPKDAKVYLREENPGIKLAGILGNTVGYLIGNAQAKAIIEKHSKGQEIEFLPFTLYNQKRRMHSKDYFFINPIGTFDCLDEKASGAKYDEDGEIVTTEKFVLDAKKVQKAPNIFRMGKVPTEYVMSFTLAQALKAGGVTNVFGYELDVR